jgi:hypothetical protein
LDIDSLFNLTVNTRPTKIHLELHIKNGWVYRKTCEIEINPPGIYVNTVTSSATLHEEVGFDNAKDIMGDEYNNKNTTLSNGNKESVNQYKQLQSNNLNNELNSPCKILFLFVFNLKKKIFI